MSLESKIKKVGTLKKVVGHALPFLEKYDALGEARILLEDSEINERGLNEEEVAQYLVRSQRQNRILYNLGKFADSADRVTSTAGPMLEGIASLIGASWAWVQGRYLQEAVQT